MSAGLMHSRPPSMWIDDDFPRILDPAVQHPELQDLLRPVFDDGTARSPTLRGQLIQEWLAALEGLQLLNGYDRNVLRQWAESGYAGARPRLSIELQAPQLAELEERKRQRREFLALQEAQAYQQWLHQAQQRQEAEVERLLLRQYPLSYPAHLEAVRQAEAEERRRIEEAIRQAAAEAARREAEQRELDEVREATERERQRIHRQALAYMEDPIGAEFSLNDGEFLDWCERIATPDEVERMTEALQVRGEYQRLPAWKRWLTRAVINHKRATQPCKD